MARYSFSVQSGAALAANTGFAWINAGANNGFKLRRVTIGVVAGTSPPTSQQMVVGINRATSAGTTPTAVTIGKLDPNSGAANSTAASAFATPPTLTATDQFQIAFNSQSGADIPWEALEEFVCASGTANGFAFVNRVNAMPASHSYVIDVETEE